ncbi:MAG: hypothetical protein HYV96_10415 [Opitutae bacterium]|nr:hypothetical protein [Opitutae bacterium]
MSTSTNAPGAIASPRAAGPLYPRATRYFALATAVTVAGFVPSYFARLGKTDAVHHFHGVTATTWMLLLVAQAHLAATRRFSLHRLLGRLSLVVAPALVISGLLVVRVMLEARNGFNRTFGAQLAFIDLTTLAYFAWAYVLAIRHRRNQPLHARWLASTAVIALPPGLARFLANFVPGFGTFESTIHASYAICLAITLLLLRDDAQKGRIRAPYVALGAVLLAHEIGFVAIPHWPWWQALMRSFAAT